MANNAWDREIMNQRERPLSSDINTLQSQQDRSLRELLKSLFTARVGSGTSDLSGNPPSGFLGDGFKVRASAVPGLSVVLSKGQGFQYLPGDVPAAIGGVNGLDDLSTYKPLLLLADASIVGISAGPAAGSDRIDIIEVRMNRVAANPLSRDTFDTGTGQFVSGLLNKTLGFALDGSTGVVTSPAASTAAIGYKMGVVAATGAAVEPSVTAGYVKIATIFSNNGNMTGSITKANIIDARVPLCPDGMQQAAVRFTAVNTAATAPSDVSQNLPAGMEVCIRKTADASIAGLEAWFIGGAQALRGYFFASIPAAGGGTSFYSVNLEDGISGLLGAGEVAVLAVATRTSNAQTFAVGTPYFYVKMEPVKQTAGVTSVPTVAVVNLHGVLKRY